MGSLCYHLWGFSWDFLSLMKAAHSVKKERCLARAAWSCVLCNEQANQKQFGDLYVIIVFHQYAGVYFHIT